MKSINEAQKLAAALVSEFGCEDMHIDVEMRRSESWFNLDLYQNMEKPEEMFATLDVNTGSHLVVGDATQFPEVRYCNQIKLKHMRYLKRAWFDNNGLAPTTRDDCT